MTNPMPIGSPLWIAAGWTMVHFYWIGAALGLSGLLGRRALGSARPEARYAFALTILAAMAVAPVATFAWAYEPSPRLSPISRQVAVGVCDQLAAPVLIGILRPVILLPPAALSGWTVEQLEMVL